MRNLKYLLFVLFFVVFCGVGYAQQECDCRKIEFNEDGTITNNHEFTIYFLTVAKFNNARTEKSIRGDGIKKGASEGNHNKQEIYISNEPDLKLLTEEKNYIICPYPNKAKESRGNIRNTSVEEQKPEIKPEIKITIDKDMVRDNEITINYYIENFNHNFLRGTSQRNQWDTLIFINKQSGFLMFLQKLVEGKNTLDFELLDSIGNSYDPKISSNSVIIIYDPPKPVELTTFDKFLKACTEEENIIFIAAGIFVLLLIIIILLVNKSKKKKKKIKKTTKSNSRITINPKSMTGTPGSASKVIQAKIGLQHLRTNGFRDFYTVNLDEVFDDTVVKNVYLRRNCIIDIYDFFQEFPKSSGSVCETGCFLFGCWEYEDDREGRYNITIEQILKPGKDASFKEDSFNFGSIDIDKEIIIKELREKTGNEWVQTAWMHSHPGLTIFLSNADLKVQDALGVRNHKSRLIAIVLDNLTENLDMVFFSAKKDGTMNNELDIRKKHSLDFLYNWAIKCAVTEETKDGYFQINNMNPDNFPNSIYLPDNVIIDINKALMVNKEGGISGFKGKIDAQYVVISDFIPAIPNINPDELMGIMLYGNKLYIKDLINEYRTFNFIAFFEIERNVIIFYIKNKDNRFELFANPVSFAELIKWNRRRRF